MTVPVLCVWLAILFTLACRRKELLYLFNGTIMFGGMTLLPPGLTGGLNLPAQTVCAGFLLLLCIIAPEARGRMVLWAMDFSKLGILALFGIFSCISAIILPRIFAGTILVYSLNAAGSISPLSPSSANFSQAIYIIISIGMVFAIAVWSSYPGFLQRFLNSVAIAGVGLVISGLVDFVFGSIGHEDMLAGFHNASYNLLDNEMIAGSKRIVGFMPEASVYGQACCCILSFLLFNYSLYTNRIRRFVLPGVILLLIFLTFESTASTGYLGLAAIGILQVLRILVRAGFHRWFGDRKFGLAKYIFIGFPLICLTIVLVPSAWWGHMQLLANLMLFQKTSTGSYTERSTWTAMGWNTFLATYWLGAGIGSVRTSNWFVNLIASTGLIGAVLFSLFALGAVRPITSRISEPLRRLRRGTMLSLLPAALMMAASATTPDPGVWVMSLFGILYGIRFNAMALAGAMAPGITASRQEVITP